MLTPSPADRLLFADVTKMHCGLNATVRNGFKYETIHKGPMAIGSSAEPEKTTATVFIIGAIGFDCTWDIPVSLMRLNHNPEHREIEALNAAMRVAYGDEFTSSEPCTVVLFDVPHPANDMSPFNTLRQMQVFEAISNERMYQFIKWGRKQQEVGHTPTEGDYLTYMRSYMREAEDQLSREHGSLNALDTLRKVVTLGVACLENHGCPDRQDKDFKKLLDN
jgi:hypothetical protein